MAAHGKIRQRFQRYACHLSSGKSSSGCIHSLLAHPCVVELKRGVASTR
jgi:hypothetical protein